MVSINKKENIFQLREYYFSKLIESSSNDPFKLSFLIFLELVRPEYSFDFNSLSLYQRCAITGLSLPDTSVNSEDISRLLGQASRIESTPRPWVTDLFGVMAVKWLVDEQKSDDSGQKLTSWLSDFLTPKTNKAVLNTYEKDLVMYIMDEQGSTYSSASIPLFLHYCGKSIITDHKNRQDLAHRFMNEFKTQYQNIDSIALLSLIVYVFDNINKEVALTPPNGWALGDLINFLEHIPVGLKRWTWETKRRTKNAKPVVWSIENEYHVQNLLYVLLAPIFNDVSDEIYLKPLGQKTPRIDLYLPSIHTIIEVKYRKNTKKSFQAFIGEVAEDISLYRADPTYKDAQIVSFLWDHTRSTQEHAKFKEGVLKMEGMDGCIVISSPSTIK